MTQPQISRPSDQLHIASGQRSHRQMVPRLYLIGMFLIQIRRPGLRQPNAWESERPQSGNMPQSLFPLLETWSGASAPLNAGAVSIMIHMLGVRNWASMLSPMQSPPLQMNLPTLTCLLQLHMPSPLPHAHPLLCLLPHMHPLPLRWQAPLCIFSLTHTHPAPLHLHICLQALCPSTHFRNFPLLCLGVHLHFLLLLVLGPLVSKALGLKYCPILSCILSWDSPAHSFLGLPCLTCQKKKWNDYLILCLFCLHQSVNTFLRLFYFAEYEILTARLVNTKLLGFHLLWDMTVYVIGCQNCPTIANSWAALVANYIHSHIL